MDTALAPQNVETQIKNEENSKRVIPIDLMAEKELKHNNMQQRLRDMEHEIGVNQRPLHAAAYGGHVDSVRALLAFKANPQYQTSKRLTALDVAKLKGHAAVVALLADAVEHTPPEHIPPPLSELHAAVEANDVERVRKILQDRGADANMKDWHGLTPMSQACRIGNVDIVRALVEAGVSATEPC